MQRLTSYSAKDLFAMGWVAQTPVLWTHPTNGQIERDSERCVWVLTPAPWKNGKPRKARKLGSTLNEAVGKLIADQ